MASSGEDYITTRQKQIARKKRILTIISFVGFVGSSVFAIVPAIQRAIQNPQPVAQTVSAESSLQEEAKGYELVLQREPNNQTALEKLSLIRLRLKDKKGAIALMEKLVQQHPDRQDYKTVLADMKKQSDSKY
ncbi:tetratricopeptide repeat protein [Nostoc parmelioides]|uniref:Tetratricopeptide repeat protein n=1 Tax=Nostoc parmelioides FACHB-3921 TaxID=2692909 RepID=A0ABR8BJ31_9NOSO|nr:tetratricopeptide repeat protein [Nostoc parmelioides]MBD2253132.1 tetratricopeptide repeat protein [Nostoc parmelioides FACHB-3921]